MAVSQVAQISVTIDGHEPDAMLAAVEATLMGHSLMNYLQDFMAPWLRKRAGDRFSSEGDDATGNWAPLKDITIEIRAKKGFQAGPINKRTGDLENFMMRGRIDYTIQGNAASMFYPGKPSGELMAKVQTAQTGKASPKTVARPVAAVSAIDMNYFLSNFTFWFAKTVQQRFHGTGGEGGGADAGGGQPLMQ